MSTEKNRLGQLHTTQPQTHLRHSILITQDEKYHRYHSIFHFRNTREQLTLAQGSETLKNEGHRWHTKGQALAQEGESET